MSSELSSMHHDHADWKSENALWHDQLREWEAEIADAIDGTAKLKQALEAHQQTLRIHAAAIRLYEQGPAQHERQLAEFVQQGVGYAACCTEPKHRKESSKHDEQRSIHETMKKSHHALMARWSLLLKALTENRNESV